MNHYKKILNKIYSYYPFYLFAVASFILTRGYYFSPGIPLGNDYLGWVARIQQFSENNEMFSIWSDWGFGLVQPFSAHIPLSLINSIVNNPSLVLSITITIVLFTTFSSMYFLTKYLSKSTLAAVLAAIVFACNQYAISKFASGHLPFSIGYALLPLIMLFYLYILDKRSKSNWIFLLLIFWITVAFTRLDIILYSVPLLVILTIGKYCTLRSKEAIFDLTKYLVIVGTLVFAGLLSLMAIQLLPMIMGAKPGYVSLNVSIPVEELAWWSLSLKKSFLGFARELGVLNSQGNIVWNSHPFLKEWQYELAMFVLPFLAICTLLIKRSWLTVSLLFLIIISVFLAKGPNEPLSDIYLWFYRNIPGFGVLKTPNRWIMLVYLSYSILFSFLIAFLVHEFRLEKINNHMRNLILFIRRNRMGFMINTLNWITIRLSKVDKIFLDKISIFSKYCILMVIIGATSYSLYIASWNIILHGFPTWNPPNEEIAPHLWLANQEGDFRVATVPYFQEFMKTEEGVPTHDLGFSSFLWSGHSVLGIGNWKTGPAYSFVNYTHGLMIDGKTSDFAKLLGRYNVRYIVVQGYDPFHIQSIPKGFDKGFQSKFINQQEGLNLVWEKQKVKIYENSYWREKIQANYEFAIVTGGRDILLKRESLKDLLPFASKNLILLRDLQSDEFREISSFGETLPELVVYQTAMSELKFKLFEDAIVINPQDFPQASNPWYVSPNFSVEENSWFSNASFEKLGIPTYSSLLISSRSESKTSTSFEVLTADDYEIWLRIRFGKDVGRLNISVDNNEIGSIFPIVKSEENFKWIKIGNRELEEGFHEFSLYNIPELSVPTKEGKLKFFVSNTDVDQIILIPKSKMVYIDSGLNKTLSRVTTSVLQEGKGTAPNFYEFDELEISDAWGYKDYNASWKIFERNSTSLEFVTEKLNENSINLVKIKYNNKDSERLYKSLVEFDFVISGIGKPLDLHDKDFFSFYYAGSGEDTIHSLILYFSGSSENFVAFKLDNSDTKLRKYIFDPNKPYLKTGDIDWANITKMRIQTAETSEEGTITFSDFKTIKLKNSSIDRNINIPIRSYGKTPIIVNLVGINPQNKGDIVDIEFSINEDLITNEIWGNWIAQGKQEKIVHSWDKVGNSQIDLLEDPDFGSRTSIKVLKNSPFSTIAEINFSQFLDLSKYSGVTFPLMIDHSNKIPENIAIVFYFQNEQTWARFSLSGNMKNQVLSFKNPNAFSGKVDWEFVSKAKLQVHPKSWNGVIDIGTMSGVQRVIENRPDQLEKNLGIYPPGDYLVNIHFNLPAGLDFISVSEGSPIFSNKNNPVISNIKRIFPSKYMVTVDAENPYMLSLMEAYHPLWRAYVNGKEIKPIILESFVNGFWIEDYLSKEIEIVFIGQRFVSIGGTITIITLAILLILLIQIKTNLFNQYQIKFQRIFKKISSF